VIDNETETIDWRAFFVSCFIAGALIAVCMVCVFSLAGCCSACHGKVCPDGRCIRE
jgi:hypothetical protein